MINQNQSSIVHYTFTINTVFLNTTTLSISLFYLMIMATQDADIELTTTTKFQHSTFQSSIIDSFYCMA